MLNFFFFKFLFKTIFFLFSFFFFFFMSSAKTQISRSKIVFVGDASVGKTSIINKFCNIQGSPTPTISATSTPVDIKIQETTVGLNLWDTAGQETYKCLVPVYARGAKVAIVVYDQTNKISYDNVRNWIDYLRNEVGVNNIVVCGNKNDLKSLVPLEDVQNQYLAMDIPIVQTSAETGENIDLLFHMVAKMALEVAQKDESNRKISNIQDAPVPQKQKNCC